MCCNDSRRVEKGTVFDRYVTQSVTPEPLPILNTTAKPCIAPYAQNGWKVKVFRFKDFGVEESFRKSYEHLSLPKIDLSSLLPTWMLWSVLEPQEVEAAVLLQGFSVADCEQFPAAIAKLAASLEVAPYRRKECAERKLDLESAFLLRKGKKTRRVLFSRFQAFLYAQTQTAMSSLSSDSGRSINGAEIEKMEGRHIEMTFSRWSILKFSFL